MEPKLIVIAAIFIFSNFFITTTNAYPADLFCDVVELSSSGGHLEVSSLNDSRVVPILPRVQQIIWHPTGSNTSIDLVIGYRGSTLAKIGEPSGAHAQFLTPNNPDPNKTVVTALLKSGKISRFSGADIHYGTGKSGESIASVNFDHLSPKGDDVIAAIAGSETLTITVYLSGNSGIDETLYALNTDARDDLLRKAKARLESSDPTICKSVPTPDTINNAH